ncbi:hypothetical protein [Flectobacillus roseus]|uniref:hypothetical protein n=1 Tax=Flectobacillus roseus TaxID=502259 RepID=UPI001411C600|nr:hypothetical protein [Flectobacillus roseus]MDI9868225.1 hypothetical protein [Flectobacillus roseus]NBA77707.1 hypothetical protein [Emticicia sp. ODNR4P]
MIHFKDSTDKIDLNDLIHFSDIFSNKKLDAFRFFLENKIYKNQEMFVNTENMIINENLNENSYFDVNGVWLNFFHSFDSLLYFYKSIKSGHNNWIMFANSKILPFAESGPNILFCIGFGDDNCNKVFLVESEPTQISDTFNQFLTEISVSI